MRTECRIHDNRRESLERIEHLTDPPNAPIGTRLALEDVKRYRERLHRPQASPPDRDGVRSEAPGRNLSSGEKCFGRFGKQPRALLDVLPLKDARSDLRGQCLTGELFD